MYISKTPTYFQLKHFQNFNSNSYSKRVLGFVSQALPLENGIIILGLAQYIVFHYTKKNITILYLEISLAFFRK